MRVGREASGVFVGGIHLMAVGFLTDGSFSDLFALVEKREQLW